MKRTHWLVLLPFALASSACGGSTVPDSTETTVGGEAESTLGARMPPVVTDLAEVAMPESAVAIVRFGPLAATFEAIGACAGDPSMATEALANLRSTEAGDTALSGLIDASSPLDLLFVNDDEGEPDDVYAFDGPSMREVVTALPRSLGAEPRSDGSLLVPPSSESSNPRTCSVEPTRSASRTRIVCSADAEALDVARTYLARAQLARVDAGVIRGSLTLDPIRARFGAQVQAGLALASTMADGALAEAESAVLRDERVRAALSTIVRDIVDDVGPLIDELTNVEMVYRFSASEVTLDLDVGVRAPSGSIVRALSEFLRAGGTVPEELLARLPPGGAVYVTGRFDTRPFDAFVAEVRELVVALARAGVQLSQADADALERGLALAMRASSYQAAAASGFDADAQSWNVSHLRYGSAAEATQALDGYRALVAAVRRPGVARAFDALLESAGPDRPRFTQIAELRTRGLPNGSLAFRMPPFEQLVSAYVSNALGATPAPMPTPVPRETFVIPNGADLLVVQAPNGRALYDSLAASGGIAADLRAALTAPGEGAMTMVIRPGNIRVPPTGETSGNDGAPTFESWLGAEAGQSLVTIHLRNTATAPDATFEVDVHAPSAFIRGILESSREAGAASAE